MADHIVNLTTNQETLYQKYLALSGQTEVLMMASLKSIFIGRVGKDLDERGTAKFAASTPAQKIAYLES